MKGETYTYMCSICNIQCDRLLVARLHAYCMYLATASSWLELILGWTILHVVIQYQYMY